MNAARIRISRVRMKNGGADVRLLRRDPQGRLASHMREYVAGVLKGPREPDAYAAVALWFDAATPGRPEYQATYFTTCDAIPAPVLVRMAGPYIANELPSHSGECRAIEALGYSVPDWNPDGAA